MKKLIEVLFTFSLSASFYSKWYTLRWTEFIWCKCIPLLTRLLTKGTLPGAGDWSYIWAISSWGSLSNVWSMRNISSVNSENFTCSEQDPTINTSCNAKVIIGDFSNGGVINGFNLMMKLNYNYGQVFFEQMYMPNKSK